MQSVGLSPLSMFGPVRALRSAQDLVASSMERLATGKQINRAADDPSGIIAAESLRAEVRAVEKQIQAAEFEVIRASAHDGAISVVGDLAVQLQSLVVTAANKGGLSEAEREALQIEADSIVQTIDFLSNTSTFQGQQILSGYHSASLGLAALRAGGSLNLMDGDLEAAQEAVDAAVEGLASSRAAWGSRAIDHEHQVAALHEKLAGLTGALSSIEDADMAREASELVRGQVLQQAAIATTMIARQSAESVLTLLRTAV